jgi:hypothetical protein
MSEPKAPKPTSKFTIPIATIFKDLNGADLTEPVLDVTGRPKYLMVEGKKTDEVLIQPVTLGLVLSSAVSSETKAEGVTLDVLDRLTLAKRFRDKDKAACEIKVSTCEQIKKLVAAHFERSPLLAGQALLLLGAEPNEDL